MRYKLVTLYPTYRNSDGGEWLVYGHAAPGVNESLGRYDTQSEAFIEAFQYGVPVMLGRNYDAVLLQLTFDTAAAS